MDVPCVHPNGADRPTLLLRVRVHACRRTISSFWTAACLPACTPEVILDRPLPQQLGRLQLTAPPGYMLIWAGPLRFRSSEEPNFLQFDPFLEKKSRLDPKKF
jgi:hypothetical protein